MNPYEFTVTSPCGHAAPFEQACVRCDHFECPICGLVWHMEQRPPERWEMTGKRVVVIDSQPNLPTHFPHADIVAKRRELAARPKQSLASVKAQIAAIQPYLI